jgi:hypothetical protein
VAVVAQGIPMANSFIALDESDEESLTNDEKYADIQEYVLYAEGKFEEPKTFDEAWNHPDPAERKGWRPSNNDWLAPTSPGSLVPTMVQIPISLHLRIYHPSHILQPWADVGEHPHPGHMEALLSRMAHEKRSPSWQRSSRPNTNTDPKRQTPNPSLVHAPQQMSCRWATEILLPRYRHTLYSRTSHPQP